jgi:hypothetical protein
VRRFWFASALLGVLAAALPAQGPGTRVVYRVRVVAGAAGEGGVMGAGEVTGPVDTRLRLGLRTDSAVVEALFTLRPEDDTVALTGAFVTRRRVGRSRRGLPLWEEDNYERRVRIAWGDTVRILPFGPRRSGLRLDLAVERATTGGVTRPAESIERLDAGIELTLEAVLRPRRVDVTMSLAQGGEGNVPTVPRSFDLIADAPSIVVALPAGRGVRPLEVALVSPEPPAEQRGRALALDADAVCLRVLPAADASGEPARQVCGRLNNVARRLALPDGDTLVATFAWPRAR